MIGEVKMGKSEFFSDLWRTSTDPNWAKEHDPSNPEAVLGLASEFGCGSDGPDCPPGWGANKDQEASNGLLGYHEADFGEPFLKIGVGKLVKGSCDWSYKEQTCATDPNYHFNSNYKFAEQPVWIVGNQSSDHMEMVHFASLDSGWAYRLHRTVQLYGNLLVMKSKLINTGTRKFTTVQFTHNFLAIDRKQINTPLQLRFGQDLSQSEEPGLKQGWSVPLASRFQFTAPNLLSASKPLPEGGQRQSILAQFKEDVNLNASASYIASMGGPAVVSVASSSQPLYGLKFFAQVTAACPEPLQQISLAPGESARWQQRLAFSEHGVSSALGSFFRGVNNFSGRGHACRGANPSDKATQYFKVSTTESLEECLQRCLFHSNCKGVGYQDSGRCEIWTRPEGISASKPKQGYHCLKFVMPEDMPGL
ncbi:unnamed protein product [Durusdinium trenchii]|uniref:Apple domain-containing protein n=1 Tax=Durusdinium trenchii TaxID=1381693 RepID=A0ABP0SJX3_9DINO